MTRRWHEEPEETPAQRALRDDRERVRAVWDLLSPSQQERIAQLDREMSNFSTLLGELCSALLRSREK